MMRRKGRVTNMKIVQSRLRALAAVLQIRDTSDSNKTCDGRPLLGSASESASTKMFK